MGDVVKATTHEYPINTRAVMFKFTVKVGASFSVVEKTVSVTFDRYSTDPATFASVPQMTSNAIHSVMSAGYEIKDVTTYYVS